MLLPGTYKRYGVCRRSTRSSTSRDKENQQPRQKAHTSAATLQAQAQHQQPFSTRVSIVGAVLPPPVLAAAAAAGPQKPPVAGTRPSSAANSNKSSLASSRLPEAKMGKRQM